MAIRTFRVFTWDRVLIYGGLCAMVTALVAKAVHYNLVVKGQQLPVPALVVLSLVVATFWGISALLFHTRWRFKQSITFYSSQGLMVIAGVLVGRKSVADLTTMVEAALEENIAFWSEWAKKQGLKKGEHAIRAYVNGGALWFVDYVLTARPVGRASFKALGLASGNWASVTWRPQDAEAQAASLLRHELGHVCLNALGVDPEGESQHKIMREAGFGY